MADSPADQRLDPELLDRLKNIAGGIFARHGLRFADARRLGGWSNLTWLAGGLVLRMSARPSGDGINSLHRLRREARLASLLPPEVGFPTVLETGVTAGHEWCLTRAVPGRNLGEVWQEMDWDGRLVALRQLWDKVEAVHSVDAVNASRYAPRSSIFYPATQAEVMARLHRLLHQKMLSPCQAARLASALDRFWQVLPSASCVLNHGDFTVENALWSEGRVVSLLDFEYALVAPAELDLNELVKFAFAPWDVLDPLPDPGGAGRKRMQQLVLEIAAPVLAHRGSRALLLGCAITLETWMLEERLIHPDTHSGVDQQPLFQILASLAGDDGGYLAPALTLAR